MDDSQKLTEEKLSSTRVFNGRMLQVYQDEVQLPDGGSSTREYIKHPGAAAVVPVYENGDVMLVRQYRYPLGRVFYEVPAGKIDEGENHAKTASRELREETGLICERMHYLAPFHPSIGYTDEIIHLYCAWDISSTDQQVDDEEFLITERMPFQKAIAMVYSGTITDGKSMVSLLMTWQWWQREGAFDIST